jgi:hypothetical protein
MIYLASPYTHARVEVMQERYELALKATYWLATTQPEPVYSPIVHWHNVAAKFNLPRDAEWWKATNFSMIRRCQAVSVLCIQGVGDSKGCYGEVELAEYLMMPVNYVNVRGEEVACPW